MIAADTQEQSALEALIDHVDDLSDREIAPAFVERVPIAYARRFGVIGLATDSETVQIAMPAVDAIPIADILTVHLGVSTEFVIAPQDQILAAINRAYSAQTSGVEQVIDAVSTDTALDMEELLGAEGDLLDNAAHAPVVKLVNMVLFEAIKRRASDVHIQPFADRVQVRLRIDGVLYDYVHAPPSLLDEIVSRIKVIGRMDIAEKRLAQDGRTTVSMGDRVVDLRISSLPTSEGERVVVRLLDKSARLYRLAELGMGPRDMDVFKHLIRQTHGIILVTGPTGSGKSTTLYSALQELDATQLNILTLEDPIEYQLPGISQTQVATKKGMTFATGLRTVLRQDPDVIMVGEIRDQETARMAVQSALTGHLVFSTLHTNDAAGAVTRLLDLGIEPYLVASSVLAVLAQRLVRSVCENCASEERLSYQQCAELGIVPATVRVGAGCDACLSTGYFGRAGIFELLEVNDAIRSLVTRRSEAGAIRDAAIDAGMATLRQDAVAKMMAGRTAFEEVIRVTHESQSRIQVESSHAGL